jgi:hypothetical protein
MFERSPQLRSCALTEGGVAVRDFAATVRRALERARRLHRPRSGRRSLVLGTALLIASTVTVVATANTPPEFTSLTVTPSVLNEGQTVTLSGTFTDSDTSDAHTVYIFWNDAPIEASRTKVQLPAGQTTFQVNHSYTDNLLAGATGIRVKVADRQLPLGSNDNTEGYGRDREGVPIQVKNVAPTLAGVSASRAGQFLPPTTVPIVVVGDIVDPGAADTHQVSTLWGDEPAFPPPTPTQCTVTGRRFRCDHSYKRQSTTRTYTIRLGVKDDDGGQGSATTSVQIPAASTASTTGTFDLSPKNAPIDPGAPLAYELIWTVPDERVWRSLDTIDLRLRKGRDTALWIRWDEAGNSFCLVNENGTCGQSGAPGAARLLDGPIATLNLGASSVQGSGPTGQSVTLNVALSFKPQAAGETYIVEAGATDDEGRHDDFKHAGTLRVEGKQSKP